MVSHAGVSPQPGTGLDNQMMMAAAAASSQQILEGFLNSMPPIETSSTSSANVATNGANHHNHEEESTSSSSSPSVDQDVADMDFSRVLQAFHMNPNMANLALSMFMRAPKEENKTGAAEDSAAAARVYKPRNSRMKVYADGFFMTFDKESSCGMKHFWRCERKNECPARLHTESTSHLIVKRIHPHNHAEPTESELAFYNIDLSAVDKDHVTPVTRSMFKCRRMSRSQADQPVRAAVMPIKQEPALPPAMPSPVSQQPSPSIVVQAPPAAAAAPIAPAPAQAPLKRRRLSERSDTPAEKSDGIDEESHEDLLELSRKIVKVVKEHISASKPSNKAIISPISQNNFMIYITRFEGGDTDLEHTYHPVYMASQTMASLRTALEQFVGRRCASNILLTVSNKVNVVIHDMMISSWKSGQFFQLDSTSNSWKMIQVNV